MERICKHCGKKFKPKEGQEQAEYCKTLCWKRENGLAEPDRHYKGGHKNIKRKKNDKTKRRKK